MDCSPSRLLSVGFSRQEYWIGLLLPPPGDLCDPGIKSVSPSLHLQVDSLPQCHLGVIPHFKLIALGSTGRTLFTMFSENYEYQLAKMLLQLSHSFVILIQMSERIYRSTWKFKNWNFLLIRFALNIQEHRASLVAQMVKNLSAVQETKVWSPGEGDGYPLQCSCLENSIDREVHEVAKSQNTPEWLTFHRRTHIYQFKAVSD